MQAQNQIKKANVHLAPSLEFRLELPKAPTSTYLQGSLILRKEPHQAGLKLAASSGLPRFQYEGAWTLKRRGCIPPSKAILPRLWSVSTQRLWMPNVTGVEGSFYAIAPFEVSIGMGLRGDFGIHFDAGALGSAGCIVITQQGHWDTLRRHLEEYRDWGFQSIPLLVVYD